MSKKHQETEKLLCIPQEWRRSSRKVGETPGNGEESPSFGEEPTDQEIKWNDVLAIYERTFEGAMGKEIKIRYVEDSKLIYEAMDNKYQVIYDRLFNRRFDNAKFLQAVGECEFEAPEIGLERCLREFLDKPKFREIPNYAVMDKLAGERTRLSEIAGIKQKMKYLATRYLPIKMMNRIRMVLQRWK